MKISIGEYDETTRQVPVRYEYQDVVHERFVNACVDAEGGYDAEATAIRCDEVGRGVVHKIEAGAIRPMPPREPGPEAVASDEEESVNG